MGKKIAHHTKIGRLSDIGQYIKPGSFVAIGGGWSCNKPMAIIREIIRQKIDQLTVIHTVGGWEMEWLLAAGCIDHLMFSFLSLEFFGLPPNFRRVAENKLVKMTEIEGCSLIKGLEAGRLGLPFAHFRGPNGSDIVKEAPQLYKTVTCPFTGKELTAIQAIVPDVAIIHAQRADEAGNIQIFGTSASDVDMAMAAKKTIVTVEEIVSGDQIRQDKSATRLFRTDVDLVIHVPFGASPCKPVPYYSAHLLQMMEDLKGLSPERAAEYIPALIGKDEAAYWANAGGATAQQKLKALGSKTRRIAEPTELKGDKAEEFDVADQIVASLARTIEDEDTIVLGSFTPLAYAAYILAKLTTAPNAFMVGYSGVDANPFEMGFHTSEAACIGNSAGLWSMTECIEALHFRGTGDVEAISSAQLDANGDFNLSWLPMPVRGADGKPTGEMNARGLRLPGGAGSPVVFGLHRKSVAYFGSHSKQTFVPKVNYVTGTKVYLSDQERLAQGLQIGGPMTVVTNLCVMQMAERGIWNVVSLHRGVTAEEVIQNTGFPVRIADDCPVTEPTKQEMELIRQIDPKGIRLLDCMNGKERAGKLPEILQQEWSSV